MATERPETRPDFWPFEEPLDSRLAIQKAQQFHATGKSWPHAITKSLLLVRAHPTVSRIRTSDQDYNKRLVSLVSYEGLLWNIERTEEIIAEGIKPPSEEALQVFEQMPPVKQAEIMIHEAQVQQERQKLLSEDNTAITLLEHIVWHTLQETAKSSPRIRKLIEDGTIQKPDDLTKTTAQRALNNQLLGYALALDDYKTIFNLISSPSQFQKTCHPSSPQ